MGALANNVLQKTGNAPNRQQCNASYLFKKHENKHFSKKKKLELLAQAHSQAGAWEREMRISKDKHVLSFEIPCSIFDIRSLNLFAEPEATPGNLWFQAFLPVAGSVVNPVKLQLVIQGF